MLETSALREWVQYARSVQRTLRRDVYLLLMPGGGLAFADWKPYPGLMFYIVPLDEREPIRFNYPSDFHPTIESGSAGIEGRNYGGESDAG